MQNVALIRLVDDRLGWYPPGSDDGLVWLDSDSARESLVATLAQRKLTGVFAAPGVDVRLQALQVAPEEKKHLFRSLPFTLEEEVTVDIGDLHFTHQAVGELDYAVAVCSQHKMQDWGRMLSEYPAVNRWIPEPLLLPWQRGEWCLLLEGARATVRTGEAEGFGIEREMVPVMLAAALAKEEPDAVIIYGEDQAQDAALLPESLHARAQWRKGNLCTALLLADQPENILNLRQGEFAARLPLGRWWRQWRLVAGLFAVALCLHLLATYFDYRALQQENIALRTAVQDSYRQAYPRGAIVDPEKQLQRQLDAMRGSAQNSGFVTLVERVGGVIAASDGTSIVSINYNDKASEMRLNILAANYDAVEQLRSGMNSLGLEAVMENSSAQGDKVRARLRVGDRS